MNHFVIETARKKPKHGFFACVCTSFAIPELLCVEISGGMSNGSQGRIARHPIGKKKITMFLSFCLSKIQGGTVSFPITLELRVHMPLLLQIAPISIS